MKGARRIWDEARAAPAPNDATLGGFAIFLDAKPLRVPGGGALILPTRPLAEAIAREWESRPKGERIGADDLLLTRLAATAQERIAPAPEPTIASIAAYGGSDLLCYRAAEPEALARRQEAVWQPWLDWAARELGASLKITTGVMPLPQDPAALAALRAAVAAASVPALAALGLAVPALGSLVLGLALIRGRLGAAEAADASLLDEMFQAELWGEDELAAERRDAIRAEIAIAARYASLAEAPK
ncbi:MAG TPA: ATP12 family protein [Acetobacteraceae bacterium]|nr:ATP12 family protein [Acetobacteraceae bacterium]